MYYTTTTRLFEGSLIDLFPRRADIRRFTGERMERVERSLRALAVTDPKAVVTARQVLDGVTSAYTTAVKNRPAHPSSHRLLAYAHLKAGRLAEAFRAITVAVGMDFESRFRAAHKILTEDQAIIASAWKRACPRTDIEARMNAILTENKIKERANAVLSQTHATTPSLRFVLNWETDANDVDFHIRDSNGGHAYYEAMRGAPPGVLYGDVVNGWGPECFAIVGENKANAFPYSMEAHYYRYVAIVTVRMHAKNDAECVFFHLFLHPCTPAPAPWASEWASFRSSTRKETAVCFWPSAPLSCSETRRM